ncbi:hypothetical protein OPQ81_001897 [Rhizoctonia solani]|nr:hypothetical protein OPQ81_001897 [Rhizoctonia solani]
MWSRERASPGSSLDHKRSGIQSLAQAKPLAIVGYNRQSKGPSGHPCDGGSDKPSEDRHRSNVTGSVAQSEIYCTWHRSIEYMCPSNAVKS